MQPSRAELLFSVKSFAAAMLAFYLALSIGLPRPFQFGAGNAFRWSLGPLIFWSIPVNGTARSRIAEARAATDAALARFDGTVLNALRETESALTASDAQLAADQVTLFLALGGGWEQTGLPQAQNPSLSHLH
jgi:hypothetical protein